MCTIDTLKKEKCTFVLEVAFRAPYLNASKVIQPMTGTSLDMPIALLKILVVYMCLVKYIAREEVGLH